jgi:hypothetical protein
MKKRVGKFLYWTPRLLSLLYVLFLMLFSLDVIQPGLSFWQIILGLFIHNIPALLLLVIVIISWKKNELVGGIVFTLAGLAYMLRVIITAATTKIDTSQSTLANIGIAISWSLTIAVPAILIGTMFIITWLKKRKKH